ncbi:MAG: hypothetical protein RR998_02665 [Oscillospiraceae bacterium]
MKRTLFLLLLIAQLIAVLVACSNAGVQNTGDDKSISGNVKLESKTDSSESEKLKVIFSFYKAPRISTYQAYINKSVERRAESHKMFR